MAKTGLSWVDMMVDLYSAWRLLQDDSDYSYCRIEVTDFNADCSIEKRGRCYFGGPGRIVAGFNVTLEFDAAFVVERED
jgi:hypothetical protein